MIVIGADISSKTMAFVWTEDGEVYHHRKLVMSASWDLALAGIFFSASRRLFRRIGLGYSDHLFIEAPVVAGARNIQTTVKQSYINGIVQAAGRLTGATCHHVPIATWKKVAIGKGTASKEEIASAIASRCSSLYQAARGDQDICDAAGICIYGRAEIRRMEEEG